MQQRSFIDGVADFDALQTNFPRFRFCSRFTVSLNFWFENHIAEKLSSLVKESSYSKTAMHLTPAEDLAFKRYIESIVYNVTKSFTKVGNLTSFPGSQNKYSTRSPTSPFFRPTFFTAPILLASGFDFTASFGSKILEL